MSNKEFTEEDIIALAQQEVDPKELARQKLYDSLSDPKKFLMTFDIKEGRAKVPVRCLWEGYKKWSKNPENKDVFCKEMATIFVVDRKSSYYYYKLNQKAWEIDLKINKVIADEKEKEEQKKFLKV